MKCYLTGLLLAITALSHFAQPTTDDAFPHQFLLQLVNESDDQPIPLPASWRFERAIVEVEPQDLSQGLWRLRSSHKSFEIRINVFGYQSTRKNLLLEIDEQTPVPIALKQRKMVQLFVVGGDGLPYLGEVLFSHIDANHSHSVDQYRHSEQGHLLNLDPSKVHLIRFENDHGEIKDVEIDAATLPWISEYKVQFKNPSSSADQPNQKYNELFIPDSVDERSQLKLKLLKPDGKPLDRQAIQILNRSKHILSVVSSDAQGQVNIDVSGLATLKRGARDLLTVNKAPWHLQVVSGGTQPLYESQNIPRLYQQNTLHLSVLPFEPRVEIRVQDANGKPLPNAFVIQSYPKPRTVALNAEGIGQLYTYDQGYHAVEGMVYHPGMRPTEYRIPRLSEFDGVVSLEPAASQQLVFQGLDSKVNHVQLRIDSRGPEESSLETIAKDIDIYFHGHLLTLDGLPQRQYLDAIVELHNQSHQLTFSTKDARNKSVNINVMRPEMYTMQVHLKSPSGAAVQNGTLNYQVWSPEDPYLPNVGQKGYRADDLSDGGRSESTKVDSKGIATITIPQNTAIIWLNYGQAGVGCFNETLALASNPKTLTIQTYAFAEIIFRIKPRLHPNSAAVYIKDSYTEHERAIPFPPGADELVIKDIPAGEVSVSLKENLKVIEPKRSVTYTKTLNLKAGEQVVLQEEPKNQVTINVTDSQGPMGKQRFTIETQQHSHIPHAAEYRFDVESNDAGLIQLDNLPNGAYWISPVFPEAMNIELDQPDRKPLLINNQTRKHAIGFKTRHTFTLNTPHSWQGNHSLVLWDLDTDIVVRVIQPTKQGMTLEQIPAGNYHLFYQETPGLFGSPMIAIGPVLKVNDNLQSYQVPDRYNIRVETTAILHLEHAPNQKWQRVVLYKLDKQKVWQPYGLLLETWFEDRSIAIKPGEYYLFAGSYGSIFTSRFSVAAEDIYSAKLINQLKPVSAKMILDNSDRVKLVRNESEKDRFNQVHVHYPFGLGQYFAERAVYWSALRTDYRETQMLFSEPGPYVFTIVGEQGYERTVTHNIEGDSEVYDLRTRPVAE